MQQRAPITDGQGGTPWIYRYKALRDWWSNVHVDRIDPVRRSVLWGGAAPWLDTAAGASEPGGDACRPLYDAPVSVAGGADAWQVIETHHAVAVEPTRSTSCA
jgi:hypothetical protein